MEMQASPSHDVLSTPGHLIGLAARGFARLAEERLKPYGFGVGQLPVLVALQEGIADTQADLARFAATRQPPMAQMLGRMTRDGLIEGHADPSDGRITRLALTDQARKRMPSAVRALLAGNREALTGLTNAEVASFLDMLERVIGNLNAIEIISPGNGGPNSSGPFTDG